MYRNYKIVPFIPAGRKKTMDLLTKFLEINKGIVDEVQIWLNTPVTEDVEYLESLDGDFFKIKRLPKHYTFCCKKEQAQKYGIENYADFPIQFNTGRFYEYTIDPDTIYVRFDDDIVWVDDNYFKNMLDYRIDHPEYLVTFGTIWNNAIVSFVAQQEGVIDTNHGFVSKPYCMDKVGWGDGPFAIYIHNLLLDKIGSESVSDVYFKGTVNHPRLKWDGAGYELLDANRFSISNFAFFGRDWATIDGVFPEPVLGKMDEEVFIAEIWAKKLKRNNAICGNAVVSHYTFSPFQKPYVNKTDIYDRYNAIAEKYYSDNYYRLLTDGN